MEARRGENVKSGNEERLIFMNGTLFNLTRVRQKKRSFETLNLLK